MSSGKSGRSATKRQEMKEKRRQRQQRRRIITFSVIGVIALLILVIAVLPSLLPSNIEEVDVLSRSQVSENTMGDPNAPVTIIEFSDFQCPFCRDFAQQVEPTLVEEYVNTGKVFFIYRSMGQWIGTESVEAVEAAYCAGDQEKFWDYHDVLYANWNGENVGAFNNARLTDFAEYLDLNMSEFNSCRSSNKYLDRVNQDRTEGEQQGVQGTPTFFINGKMYTGGLSVGGFNQAIEAELSASE